MAGLSFEALVPLGRRLGSSDGEEHYKRTGLYWLILVTQRTASTAQQQPSVGGTLASAEEQQGDFSTSASSRQPPIRTQQHVRTVQDSVPFGGEQRSDCRLLGPSARHDDFADSERWMSRTRVAAADSEAVPAPMLPSRARIGQR